MQSQVLLMALYALLVSAVFAVLSKDELKEQLRLGGMMFGGLVGMALVLCWLMLVVPL